MRQERRKQFVTGPNLFPERLLALRRQRGWTQRHVAERTGINASQITRYEKGQAVPNADALKLLAECFEIPIDNLVSGTSATLEDKELLEEFHQVQRLPERDKALIKEILHTFLARRKLEDFVSNVKL